MDSTNESQVMNYVQENMDNIPFKTLRHGEQELTAKEKLIQMQRVLHDDPALFLGKWGRYLSQNTLRLFQPMKDNYEVDFYLDNLLYNEKEEQEKKIAVSTHGPSKNHRSAMHTLVQNRRYEYLKRHLKNSDYFSDESIQLRDPILYDQFIGQYITSNEKKEPFADDITLVNRIFSNMDRKFVNDTLHLQKMIDEEQFEEEEESDDEVFEKSTLTVITKKKNKDVEMTDAIAEDEEEEEEEEEEGEDVQDMEGLMEFREEQRLELIRLLEEKFLAGKDDFDYDQVDYNEDYDDIVQQERDIQDRYFDED